MKRFKYYLLILTGIVLFTTGCGDSDGVELTSYTVTFNSVGGSAVNSQTVVEGQKVTEPTAPTKTDFIFGGWHKEAMCITLWDFASEVVRQNITLYAAWIPVSAPTYTVTFDSQEGSNVDSQIIPEGGKVAVPTPPTKDGFTFDGWYKEPACENKWDFLTDAVTGEVTLYASWVTPVYTVLFDTKGGSTIDPQEITEGEKAAKPADPAWDGYTFEGWYEEDTYENEWNFTNNVVTEDLTIFAKWKEKAYPGCVFISPTGSDENDGAYLRPFATLGKAKSIVDVAANNVDTVYMRGGTYNVSQDEITRTDNTWAYVYDFSSNSDTRAGSNSKRICYWGFPGERPVLNLSQVKPTKRVIVFYMARSYYHFKNFEIVGTQVNVLGHTQSECIRSDGGNYNIYENLAMHDGMAIGFYLVRGHTNTVLNCDAYNNYDNYSEGAKGGNVDGFGGHPNSTATNNVFRGCRAWWNSDDGFDLISAHSAYVIENCWSFYNGYQPGTFDSAGDGTGFKAGGYGMSETSTSKPSHFPSPIPVHEVKGCLAYRNKNHGFYANHHLGGIIWYNNTGYYNPNNFNMLNRKSAEVLIDDPDGGYGHILKNNLSYEPRTTGNHIINVNTAKCEISHNSFPSMSLTASDFVSLDASQLMLPRKADGSLPDIDFMRPKPTSGLIGTGTAEAGTGNMNIGCF